MKKEYKYNKNWLRKEARKELTSFEYNLSDVNVNGKTVGIADHCSSFHGTGAIMAGVTFTADGVPVIIRDEIYDNAPAVVKEFLTMHEIGHLVHGHIQFNPDVKLNKKQMVRSALRRFLPGSDEWKHEREADKYAAQCCGVASAVAALYWILDNIELPLSSAIEIGTRAWRLEMDGVAPVKCRKEVWDNLNRDFTPNENDKSPFNIDLSGVSSCLDNLFGGR